MFRKHELVPSREMGRQMHLWRFGHFGAPVLVCPSASGMAHEWDAHGMIEGLGDLIDRGRIKLYCTESNVAEAWTRKEQHPARRIREHQRFERYITSELVPLIRADCRSEGVPIAVTGTSLGALYSANFALKYPEIFRWALCMSGRYNVDWLTHGYHNEDIYFSNPLAYVPNLDGEQLERIRENTHLVLQCGQGRWEDGNIEETQELAGMLAAKGISHELDLWGHDVHHEWGWWLRQAIYHLSRRFD